MNHPQNPYILKAIQEGLLKKGTINMLQSKPHRRQHYSSYYEDWLKHKNNPDKVTPIMPSRASEFPHLCQLLDLLPEKLVNMARKEILTNKNYKVTPKRIYQPGWYNSYQDGKVMIQPSWQTTSGHLMMRLPDWSPGDSFEWDDTTYNNFIGRLISCTASLLLVTKIFTRTGFNPIQFRIRK